MISYAQVCEDIILHRAIGHLPVSDGFYIDVGGYHPIYDSVTKHFYDIGWRGINIEPGKTQFPAFLIDRPRDINLQMAISDHIGETTFYEMDQTSTLETRFVGEESDIIGRYTVPVTTISSIFEQYAPAEVHFLKIDVEGHEAAVLRGMDFNRHRPWIMLIESFEPNHLDRPTHAEWEAIVLNAGYRYNFTDGLNRYYVAPEHRELEQHFAVPIDHYQRAREIWHRQAFERELTSARLKILELEQKLNHLCPT